MEIFAATEKPGHLDLLASLVVVVASSDGNNFNNNNVAAMANSNKESIFEADVPIPAWTDFDVSERVNSSLEELTFNEGHAISIFAYSLLMLVSAIGNLTVLKTIIQQRRRASTPRINIMLMHLAIADLLVTFLMMPIDITWAATVRWVFGETFCRIGAFLRVFGLYLSSFIIICISIDRYLAVLKPMSLYHYDYRGKIMISIAWIASIICSFPQSIIYHMERHPIEKGFEQCVTLHAFSTRSQELAYLYSCMIIMYCLPLCVIVFCYTSIIREIHRQSSANNMNTFRRSGLGALGAAKTKTLKMTITIVVVFLICWTPYYIISVWFWTDSHSARQVDYKIQRMLFIFASTNSCANPIVYGIFNMRKKHDSIQIRPHKNSLATTYPTEGGRIARLNSSLRSVE